jgi:cytochrome o ubiquinol oxidase subunit IV
LEHDTDVLTGLEKKHPHGTFTTSLVGFALSVFLTLAAYFFVVGRIFLGWWLTSVILVLALVQMWVQLVYFLHLGDEPKPQWNLLGFLFMILVVLIVVFGTIWIMNNLNYRMMLPMPD